MKNKLAFAAIFLLALLLFFANTDQLATNAQSPNFEIFVAENQSQCQGRSQCFYNDAPDTIEATALQKAVNFARENNLEGANIHILAPYEIKTQMVIVDFPVNLIGENGGWLSTSSSNCSQPMLKIQDKVVIKNIYISDGNCSSPSRDLIYIDSDQPVLIEHSTLELGSNAIVQKNNSGNLTIRFNDIKNNNNYAVLSENTEISSSLVVVANNIFGNGNQEQVVCQKDSSVDHNYWGENVLPTAAAKNCGADNQKVLGAQILSNKTGVAATLLKITSTYPTQDFYGFSAKSEQDTSLFVVNHADKKPFQSLANKSMTSCGNFFDVFLPEETEINSITLRFKYNKNNSCQQSVNSISLCGSGTQKNFPLMWLDPKTSVTEGWDNVGDSPKSPTGNIFDGQETRCDFQNKTIEVVIDNDGRPNLSNDLHFTPMTVGFEISAVIVVRPVETEPGNINIAWGTTSEINTSGFRIVRSETEEGPFEQIGKVITSRGSSLVGEIYDIDDSNITPSTYYFYKLEVLDTDGDIQQSIGPIRIQTGAGTSTPRPSQTPVATRTLYPSQTFRPTSTRIPTRTPTPFLTATNSYRTPRPTYVTKTPIPTPLVTRTFTPTIPNFEKPTSFRSTSTIRPTFFEGEMLIKKDHNPKFEIKYWIPISLGIIIIFFGFYFYIKHRKP